MTSESSFDLTLPGQIRFGAGRVAEVPAALTALEVSRVLVVTGRTPSRADALRAALEDVGITSTAYAVDGEPTVENCRAAVARVRADRPLTEGTGAVIGYGGGSALDLAKAVAVLATSGHDPLDHLEVIGSGRPIAAPGLPCVAIPTTAGTGSEVTRNAVLTAGDVKASLRSPHLLPTLAVVDPDLLAGAPGPVVAASGMDALTQLIEPLLSRRAGPVTDALARDGIARSVRSLRRAYVEGMVDAAVREDLALASLYGGICLANAGLGVVHGLAAALGARLSAPHGAVCAATLAAAVDVNRRALADRAPEHPALARIDELGVALSGDPAAGAMEAVTALTELTVALQIPGLRTYGLGEADLATVAETAQRASSMRANPIELTAAEVSEILARSL